MMIFTLVVCSAFMIPGVVTTSGVAFQDAARLTKHMKSNLARIDGKQVLPSRNSTDTVQVSVVLGLTHINGFDRDNMMGTAYATLVMGWRDFRLMWDPSDFGLVKQIIVHSSSLWIPDMKLGMRPEPDTDWGSAIVDYDGYIHYEKPVSVEFLCSGVEGQAFVTCNIHAGSWLYHSQQLDISSQSVNLDMYRPNPRFNIKNVSAKRNEFWYECCPERYPIVNFSFELGFNSRSGARPADD